MTTVERAGSDEAEAPKSGGITLSALEGRLGAPAARELFSRVDRSLREGDTIFGTSVREARSGFHKVHAPGHVQVVTPGRITAYQADLSSTPDSLVILKLEDLEAVVQAGRGDFDWAKTFSPRGGLEAALSTPKLKRGSRGRRQLQP
jgi:hypothetical protein